MTNLKQAGEVEVTVEFEEVFLMFFTKPAAILLAVAWLTGMLITMGRFSVEAKSQTVLTILLRDSLGHPLEGVLAEVLSYDWGMPRGQAYGIIARGETDKNGVVAFDNTIWPFSGYRIKFTPTGHTRPTGEYFLPDDQNQYRGYPGISTGGLTETQKFVLSGSDGLFYNDLSGDGELPQYQRDPVGGMLNPRVSVMPGQDFVATALAATATAEARGEPTPTFPPPPAASPRPDQVQSPLTVTPGVQRTNTVAATQTTSVVAVVVTSPPPVTDNVSPVTTARPASSNQTANQPPKSAIDLLGSIVLAVAGIVALIAFWKFRFRLYPLLGIEIPPKSRKTYAPERAKQPGKPKAPNSDKK